MSVFQVFDVGKMARLTGRDHRGLREELKGAESLPQQSARVMRVMWADMGLQDVGEIDTQADKNQTPRSATMASEKGVTFARSPVSTLGHGKWW